MPILSQKIYNFLSTEIEEYMRKFEVLVTDEFRKKEIVKPKIGTVGIKVESDLLKIDLSQIDFDVDEIKEIMQKYNLKKKYHRLKDGRFLSLEENDTMDFINGLINNNEIGYSEIQKGVDDYDAGRYQDGEAAFKKLLKKYE